LTTLFLFNDIETDMGVLVRECDLAKGYSMIVRMLQSESTPHVNDYDALEFASAFVSANKRKPFDVVFVGEVAEDELLDDISMIFEVSRSSQGLLVTPLDNKTGDPKLAGRSWEMRPVICH